MKANKVSIEEYNYVKQQVIDLSDTIIKLEKDVPILIIDKTAYSSHVTYSIDNIDKAIPTLQSASRHLIGEVYTNTIKLDAVSAMLRTKEALLIQALQELAHVHRELEELETRPTFCKWLSKLW